MNGAGVVLFHTNSAALRSEKLAQRAGFVVKLIPTPREFSSDCGIALRFDWELHSALADLLAAHEVDIAGIRRMQA